MCVCVWGGGGWGEGGGGWKSPPLSLVSLLHWWFTRF